MSIPNLPTNFKDDILNTSVNSKRKYKMINNTGGTVSFEDKTDYTQEGSEFGAGQINATNDAINKIYSERILSLEEAALVTEPGFFVDAMVVPELIGEMDSKNFLRENDYEMTYITIHTSYDDRVDALRNSLVNNSSLWKQGLTATYIVSDNSDDRGMAIVMKKVNPGGALRLAFQYWDYWGVNEFWCYTNAGWEKK